MLKAIILDDEKMGSDLLQKKLALQPRVNVVKVFNDPLAALKEIDDIDFDVLFLDVEMPNLNGFKFLETLGSFSFEVIFVTAFSTYTLDALRMQAVDYLLKPVDEEELTLAILRLSQKIDEKKKAHNLKAPGKNRIALHTAEGIHFIEKSQIIKVEAMSNYSIFMLEQNKKIVVSKTLKEFETVLNERNFMRVNRSVILNLDYVIKYKKGDGGTLELADGTEVEVSPAKKEELMELLFHI